MGKETKKRNKGRRTEIKKKIEKCKREGRNSPETNKYKGNTKTERDIKMEEARK